MKKSDNIILSLLQGNEMLWKAFWIVGISTGILIAASWFLYFSFLLRNNHVPIYTILIVISVIIAADGYWLVCVVKCSPNTNWKGWRLLSGMFISIAFIKHSMILCFVMRDIWM
jgi:hypothetical protein